MQEPVSPLRHGLSKIFYYLCGGLGLIGVFYLFTDFGGNIWVFLIFGGLAAFIIGNTLTHPGSSTLAEIHPDAPVGVLSQEEVRTLADEEHRIVGVPRHDTNPAHTGPVTTTASIEETDEEKYEDED